MNFENIMISVGAGIVYSLSAFAKKEGQDFDMKKFATTIGFGAGIGIISSVMNLPLESAEEFAISVGLIAILENTTKAIYRKIVSLIPKKK